MESLNALIQGMGLMHLGIGQAIMLLVSLLLLWLAIAKKFEPLLLLPIGFGGLLSNIPEAGLALTALESLLAHHDAGQLAVIAAKLNCLPDVHAIKEALALALPSVQSQMEQQAVDMGYSAGVLAVFYKVAIGSGIAPLVIFMGVGAMTDFGPLLANPRTLLLGAAAQFGIFATTHDMTLLSGTVFGYQQNHTGEQSFRCIIEKCILTIRGGIPSPGADDGFGGYLRILLCLCLVRQVCRFLQIQIHIFVYHSKDIVSVRPGRVSQIQNGDIVAIIFSRNIGIVSVQISLCIGTDKAHPAGTGIFNIRVKKICCLTHTCCSNHECMDIVCINQCSHSSSFEDSPYNQSLCLRQSPSLPPFLWKIFNVGECLADFLF